MLHQELTNATVHNLMTEDGREWDADILNELCNDRDKELIYQVPIPLWSKSDSWFWLPDAKGKFSVRSCYRLLKGESECQERQMWTRLWSLKLPGKILFFLWRVVRGVLPTVEALRNKRVEIVAQCRWCHNYAEDVGHVLFQCCFAREIWENVGMQNLVYTGEVETGIETIKRVLNTAT